MEKIEGIAIVVHREIENFVITIEKGNKLKIDNFPYLISRINFYKLRNQNLAKNRVFNRFLEGDMNLKVFVQYLFYPNLYKEQLDQQFREFYFEYRFISYVSKLLYYEAIHFDQKKRKLSEFEQPILYQSDNDEGIPLIEKLPNGIEMDIATATEQQLEDHFSNDMLFKGFKALTANQQNVIFYSYVNEMKDVEIANKMQISQQAVSKTRKSALEKLRKYIGGGLSGNK